MIKCPNCTGELKFKPEDKQVICEYCGSKFDPKELDAKVKMAGESKNSKSSGEQIEGKAYTCSQCGATLLTFDDTAITFCSYCGSQAMIEEKMMKVNKPDFVIPFEKSRDDCINAYKRKVSSALFVPSYLKSDVVLDKFRGIYIPYGIYKLTHNGNCSNKGSKYSHRSGDYVYYDDYSISCDVDCMYDGISHDLISKFYDKFSTAIPYNYKKKEEYNPNYLIGYYADSGDVSPEVYDNEMIKVGNANASSRLRANREFSKYGCSNPTVSLGVSERKTGMFPMYFLAIRNKDNKNVNYAVVNGQTGEVACDLPISFTKYLIFSLVLSVVVFLLIDNLFVLTPISVTIFTVISGVLSFILSFIQASKIKSHSAHTDDIGFISKNKDVKKEKIHVFQYFIKEIIAVILPILVLVMHPVHDYYYYGVSIFALLLVVLSFYDLVKEHNILTTNKLPQLEKRGGDESE